MYNCECIFKFLVCCMPTDDKPATNPPTISPTTYIATSPTTPHTTVLTTPSTTPAPTTKPSKMYYVICLLFILNSITIADKQMSVTVQFESIRYTVQESCTLLSVRLEVMGEVIEPFTVDVIPIGLYASAKGMQHKYMCVCACVCVTNHHSSLQSMET